MMETHRHFPDTHDGVCVRCGGVLSPVDAVQRFGIDVMTAGPGQRVARVLARQESLGRSWAAGDDGPSLRWRDDAVRELRERGLPTRLKVWPCDELPVHPDQRLLFGGLDVLASMSRALDRGITRALRPPSRRRRRKWWEEMVSQFLRVYGWRNR